MRTTLAEPAAAGAATVRRCRTTAAASSTRCRRRLAPPLPAVVAHAVGDHVEVLADGGVRTGLDVVKMMALGARAVLIGRAWAWVVAARGEAGVLHMLDVMKADIDVALALTGQTSVTDLDRSALYEAGSSVLSP